MSDRPDEMRTNPDRRMAPDTRSNPDTRTNSETPSDAEMRDQRAMSQAPAGTQAAATTRPAVAEPVRGGEQQQQQVWPEYEQFHQRFHQIEMEFIDEPKAAVEKAEKLMQEAIDRMMSGLREQVQRMHGEVGRDADTERLRITMLSYRRLMDSMAGRRVA